MIRKYQNTLKGTTFLERDAEGRPADRKLCVAAAAILLEMAMIDGQLCHDELMEIVCALNHEFKLMDEESGDIIEISRVIRSQRGGVDSFITELNNRLSDQQRLHLCEIMWQIAEADGVRHHLESDLHNRILSALKLAA